MTIKKGDNVLVLSGKSKGQKGIVERTIPLEEKVVVTGANIMKRHLKPSKTQPRGGIVERPAAMARSKVMLVCPHCSKPTRIRHTVGETGKHRSCQFCNGNLDTK